MIVVYNFESVENIEGRRVSSTETASMDDKTFDMNNNSLVTEVIRVETQTEADEWVFRNGLPF